MDSNETVETVETETPTETQPSPEEQIKVLEELRATLAVLMIENMDERDALKGTVEFQDTRIRVLEDALKSLRNDFFSPMGNITKRINAVL